MKKLSVLILVLILAFAAMGAMADECAHDGGTYSTHLRTEDSFTPIEGDNQHHTRRYVFVYEEFCSNCNESIRTYTEYGEPFEEEHSYRDEEWHPSETCLYCGHKCDHNGSYDITYEFADDVYPSYVPISGDNLNHTVTKTGQCTVRRRCTICGHEEVEPSDSETETVQNFHDYDEDGKCINCGHTNTCQDHPNYEVCIEVNDETCEYSKADSNDYHLKVGSGRSYKRCKDCNVVFDENTEGEFSVEDKHSYSYETDEAGNQIAAVCDKCGWKCTHEWDDNAWCSICYMSHSHQYDTSKADGVCTICGKNTCSHSFDNGVCTTCGFVCEHDWDDYGNCSNCNMHHEHQYDTDRADGVCTICGKNTCSHSFDNGVCTTCGFVCEHEWDDYGNCSNCYMTCSHEGINEQELKTETINEYQYKNDKVHSIVEKTHDYRQCPVCGYKQIDYSTERTVSTGVTESHTYEDGVCTVCYTSCSHQNLSKEKIIEQSEEQEWTRVDAKHHAKAILKITYQACETCGTKVLVDQEIVNKDDETTEEHHFDENGYCDVCKYQCEHQYIDGVCDNCGYACSHNFNPSNGICEYCGYQCPHTNTYEAAEEEEYIWIDANTHQHRRFRKLYCNDCHSIDPVGTEVIEEVNEAHSFDGDTCSACGFSKGSNIQSPEYPDDETLVIHGSGAIPNYTSADPAPWAGTASSIRRIIIDKDITAIGAYAFAGFDNPDLRVEFLQGSVPAIDKDAFAGRTEKVVCRYYSESGIWPHGNTEQTWIYLPYFDIENQNGTHEICFNGRWFISPRGEGGYRDIYVTSDQALEYSYDWRYLSLQAIPDAGDSIMRDWDKVARLVVNGDDKGELIIELNENSALRQIDMNAPNVRVKVTDEREGGFPGRILFTKGTLDYQGDIQELEMDSSEEYEGHATITGNIYVLNYYPLDSDKPFKGDLAVNGTIYSGNIYSNQTFDIPGIGNDVVLSGVAGQTFKEISQDTPIIQNSLLNLTPANQAKLVGNIPDLDQCGYKYQYMEHRIRFVLEPKGEGIYYSGEIDNIYDWNPEFTTDDIIYSEDTEIDIYDVDTPLVFNGKTKDGKKLGIHTVSLEPPCQVVLNCPVENLTVNHFTWSIGAIDLAINDKVGLCNISVKKYGTTTSVRMGKGGFIETGVWERPLMEARYFESVSGPCDLFVGDHLNAMSYKEGQTTRALLPSNAAVSEAAGQNAMVDVEDATFDELGEDEQNALSTYFEEGVDAQEKVAAVFDVSVNSYTDDGAGNIQPGDGIPELNKPIPLTVSNNTGDFVYVVRLHEYDGSGTKAEKLNDATAQKALEFESNLFSKYLIVKSGDERHVHELSYAVNEAGDTITVTCVNTDEGCGMPINGETGKHQVTLKIIAPELETEGDDASEKATLEGYEDFNAALGWNTAETADQAISDASIVYTTSDGLTSYPEAPTAGGSYTAKLTVDVGEPNPLTIQVDYEIKKNTPDYTLPEGLIGVYGDALSTVGLPTDDPLGTWAWADGTIVISGVGDQTFDAVFRAEGYDPLTVKVTVTVSPKSVTITGLSAENKTYDGTTEATPTGSAVIEGKLEGDDVTVKAGTAAFADANAGTGKTVTFAGYELDGTAKDNYELFGQPASVKADITAKSIEGATVTLDNEKIEHTGSELRVAVQSVVLEEQTLSAETDYVVSGDTTGTDMGEYTVTVTGKGNYTGEATAKWKITNTLMEVTAEDMEVTYDGQAHGIKVTVKAKNTQQNVNTATIRYGTDEGTYGETVSPTITNVGTLTVHYQVTAEGYETETGSATVTIKPKAVETPAITVAEGSVYDGGAEIKPTVTVKDGETEIPASEYTVVYSNNTNAGTATVTIADAEGGNYNITQTKQTFDIAPKTVESPTITVAEGTYVYNDGAAIEPTVTVKDGETEIPASEYTVDYSNNKNAGMATVTIADKEGGNYAVSGIASFTIDKAANPAQVNNAATVVMGGNQVDLAGNVTGRVGDVTFAINEPANGCTLDGSKLTSGGTVGNVTVTVTVAGDNNHAQLIATITVTVEPKSIGEAVVTLSAEKLEYTGNAQSVTVSSVTLDSVTLIADTDYEVADSSALSGTNVAEYTVTVTGNGNYTGEATATWQITKAASGITTAPAAVENLTYTGEAQELVTAGTPNGGTMNYAVTMENAQPAETEFKADLPKETDTGTYYVWFMVKGDDNHEDTAVASSPVTVAIGEVDKTELTTAIGDAETYYNTIKDNADYTVIAATLKSAIDAAQAVANNPNVTAAQVSNAKKSVADAEEAAKADKQAADEKKAADEAAAKAVTDAIDALPDNAGVNDKTAVSEARKAYEALSADQKKLVSGDELKKLTDAEDSVKAAEKKIADEAAAKAVTDAFDALPDNAGVNDKTAVSEARKAYEALSADQKKLVSGDELKKLTNAEASVQAAEEAAKKAAEEAARKAAEEEAARKAAEEAARKAAEEEAARKAAEEEAAKKAAEEEAARKAAEEAAAKQAADEAAAKSVEDAIRALSDSAGTGDKGAVEEARRAYDALTEDQKKLVPGDALSKLTAAEQQVAAAEEAAKTVKISDCKITVKSLAYTGKKIKKPTVTVMYDGQKLKEGTDYSFTYNKKAKAIGAYIVTVKGKGRFTGSKKVTLKVVPKGTAFSKVTGGSKQVTLKWKSQKNITGYQIEYSLKKDFSASKKVTVKKAKTLSTTIRKLKASTKYYVRIRTYTTVKKKNYYSAWSKAKTVKTKAGRAGNESVEPEIEIGIDVGDMSLEIDEISIDEIILDDGGTINDGEIIVDEVVEVPVE